MRDALSLTDQAIAYGQGATKMLKKCLAWLTVQLFMISGSSKPTWESESAFIAI